jgi:hypothetical protein
MEKNSPTRDPLSETLSLIIAAFDRLKISYAVGGSMASSARGVWRSTLDVDLVAAIQLPQVAALVEELGSAWYADAETIRDSIEAGRSFNVIYMPRVMKVDIFPATEEFHQQQLERATLVPLGLGQVPCAVATAEDILLAKLRWYRDGGQVSDRQWSDIVGLISNNLALDSDYLQSWAVRLQVEDLLRRAIADVNRDDVKRDQPL